MFLDRVPKCVGISECLLTVGRKSSEERDRSSDYKIY
jgi:hypothetical protein